MPEMININQTDPISGKATHNWFGSRKVWPLALFQLKCWLRTRMKHPLWIITAFHSSAAGCSDKWTNIINVREIFLVIYWCRIPSHSADRQIILRNWNDSHYSSHTGTEGRKRPLTVVAQYLPNDTTMAHECSCLFGRRRKSRGSKIFLNRSRLGKQ